MNTALLDRLVVALDEAPSAQVSRVALGSAVVFVWAWLTDDQGSAWTLALVLLFTLAMMRLAPLVARTVIPFADETKSVWAERRQLAKRYDSYQWQKLLWVGIGMVLASFAIGQRGAPVVTLTTICLTSGAAGLIMWRRIAPAGDRGRRVLREPAQCS